MSFTFQAIGVDEVRKAMSKLGADLPGALAAGLNRTVRAIEQAELNGMERSIDRPTPYTLNALRTWQAHPRHLDGGIFVLPDQAKYLKFAIEGGTVESTIVPVIGRAKLTREGNVPSKKTKGMIGAKGRKSSRSRGFFIGTPGSSKTSIKPYGLWERIGRDRVQLIARPEKGVRRDKRFAYLTIAEQEAEKRLGRDLLAAIDSAASNVRAT